MGEKLPVFAARLAFGEREVRPLLNNLHVPGGKLSEEDIIQSLHNRGEHSLWVLALCRLLKEPKDCPTLLVVSNKATGLANVSPKKGVSTAKPFIDVLAGLRDYGCLS